MEDVVVDAAFFHGKKVLVTGHTGFKGGWLSLWLKSLGAEVTGYALPPPTDPNLFEHARVAEGIDSVIGDVRDGEKLRAVIGNFRPELIIHMAAQPLVRRSYRDPVETYETNVMGTVNMLDAVRQVGGVRAVINVTSDKCYENREWVWGYRENDSFGGHDPYSNSKGCSELVTSAFRHSFFPLDRYQEHGLALASTRAGNVIGGGDWSEDRLVPDILRALEAGEEVLVRHPEAIRPWQHVLEPLAGYLILAQKLFQDGPQYAEGWNFGPEDRDCRSVAWVVDRLVALWGGGARWIRDQSSQPHEATFLKLDCSKARNRLGWRPAWPLERSLEMVIAWHRALQDGRDMRRTSLDQITNVSTETPDD
jgi:CDP-glucose 4,6-dehydratase